MKHFICSPQPGTVRVSKSSPLPPTQLHSQLSLFRAGNQKSVFRFLNFFSWHTKRLTKWSPSFFCITCAFFSKKFHRKTDTFQKTIPQFRVYWISNRSFVFVQIQTFYCVWTLTCSWSFGRRFFCSVVPGNFSQLRLTKQKIIAMSHNITLFLVNTWSCQVFSPGSYNLPLSGPLWWELKTSNNQMYWVSCGIIYVPKARAFDNWWTHKHLRIGTPFPPFPHHNRSSDFLPICIQGVVSLRHIWVCVVFESIQAARGVSPL